MAMEKAGWHSARRGTASSEHGTWERDPVLGP